MSERSKDIPICMLIISIYIKGDSLAYKGIEVDRGSCVYLF